MALSELDRRKGIPGSRSQLRRGVPARVRAVWLVVLLRFVPLLLRLLMRGTILIENLGREGTRSLRSNNKHKQPENCVVINDELHYL